MCSFFWTFLIKKRNNGDEDICGQGSMLGRCFTPWNVLKLIIFHWLHNAYLRQHFILKKAGDRIDMLGKYGSWLIGFLGFFDCWYNNDKFYNWWHIILSEIK